MKKLTMKIVALALVLMSLLPMGALATSNLSSDSDAYIDFKAGEIENKDDFDEGEVGFKKINLKFGLRSIPIRAELYVADGTVETAFGSYLPQDGLWLGDFTNPAEVEAELTPEKVGVVVVDPRKTTTEWNYYGRLAKFVPSVAANAEFDATLVLRNGVGYTNGDQALIGTQLLIQNDPTSGLIEIYTDDTGVLVLNAKSGLGRGTHGAMWTNDNILLQLVEADANPAVGGYDVIKEDTYQAAMVWTLDVL